MYPLLREGCTHHYWSAWFTKSFLKTSNLLPKHTPNNFTFQTYCCPNNFVFQAYCSPNHVWMTKLSSSILFNLMQLHLVKKCLMPWHLNWVNYYYYYYYSFRAWFIWRSCIQYKQQLFICIYSTHDGKDVHSEQAIQLCTCSRWISYFIIRCFDKLGK